MGGDIPTEDRRQDAEAAVETTTYQANSWQQAHASSLDSSVRLAVQENGRYAEGAVIASSGGYRGNDSGGVPVEVQEHDGERVAMNNFKNALYAQAKLDNRVMLAPDQTENRAKTDAALIAEIKDRAPIASALGANGDLKSLTAMVTKLNEGGPVAITAAGPSVTSEGGMPAAPSLRPSIKTEFALS